MGKKRKVRRLQEIVEQTRAAFKNQLRPGVRVVVYKDDVGMEAYVAIVVRVNKVSITIEAEGRRKRVRLDAIADLAPGERARLSCENQ